MSAIPKFQPQEHFAWCGWALRIPQSWRPLKFYGNGLDGSVHLGDADRGILRVRWKRTLDRRPDPGRWKKRRIRTLGGHRRGRLAESAPATPAVQETVLVQTAQGVVWSGFSAPAGIALEIAFNAALEDEEIKAVLQQILPTMRVFPISEETPWALFDTTFRTPPGFLLEQHRLHLGDLAILVATPGKNHWLMVRQVYPAELALERRPLEKWLGLRIFPDRRRRRRFQGPDRWELRDGARALDGLLESGVSRLPAPLGFWHPRVWTAALVRDPVADRLLMAEAELENGNPFDAVQDALSAMNRPLP